MQGRLGGVGRSIFLQAVVMLKIQYSESNYARTLGIYLYDKIGDTHASFLLHNSLRPNMIRMYLCSGTFYLHLSPSKAMNRTFRFHVCVNGPSKFSKSDPH